VAHPDTVLTHRAIIARPAAGAIARRGVPAPEPGPITMRCEHDPAGSPGAYQEDYALMELSMFELSGIGGLILLALDIYALISIFNSRSSTTGKVLWSLAVIIFPLVGFIAWLIFGPRSAPRHV
jgi:hypothetical protein